MQKIKNALMKLSHNSITAFALVIVAASATLYSSCVFWIFGSDEIPDELL